MIHGMNHFTVLTDDLDKTLGFYVDLLGLKPGPRPEESTWNANRASNSCTTCCGR